MYNKQQQQQPQQQPHQKHKSNHDSEQDMLSIDLIKRSNGIQHGCQND